LERREFVAGEFNLEGTSGKDTLGALSEFFRVQLQREQPKAMLSALPKANIIAIWAKKLSNPNTRNALIFSLMLLHWNFCPFPNTSDVKTTPF